MNNSVVDISHPVPDKPDGLLLTILTTRRADGSVGDTNFRLWLIDMLRNMDSKPSVDVGPRGCIIATTNSESTTLFSCHIDTCHSIQESTGKPQKLAYDSVMGHLFLDPKEPSGCLGADDGAGIYIMLRMLEAGIDGSYVFHTGEEIDGQGAKAMLKDKLDWLKKFKRAVAFDRPHNHEVIITQGGTVCASNLAGIALVQALNAEGMDYEVSTKGVFTDTKVYAPVIPECFNLGVGYYSQHGPNETLDVAHVEALIQACIRIDWDNLPVHRSLEAPKPMIKKPELVDDDYFGWKPKPVNTINLPSLFEELDTYSLPELEGICEDIPTEAAYMIIRLNAALKGKVEELQAVYRSLGVQ